MKNRIVFAACCLFLCQFSSTAFAQPYTGFWNQTLVITLTNGDDNLSVYRSGNHVIVTGGPGSGLYEIISADAIDSFYIRGRAGNDNINMGAGLDDYYVWVYGNDGHDTITGSPCEIFRAYGGEGNDTLKGTDGADFLSGDQGSDIIYGYGGDDTIDAAHYYFADQATDVNYVFGGDGDDYIEGGRGQDFIWADSGNDTLIGKGGADFLDGGFGDDQLIPSSATESYELYLVGGPGADEFHVLENNGSWLTLAYGHDYNSAQGDTLHHK